jgi:hypothetical protein
MRTLNGIILFTAVVCGVWGCRSAPPAAVSEKVMACGRLQDEAQRYRCYDGLNASLRPTRVQSVNAASAAPPASASVPRAMPSSPSPPATDTQKAPSTVTAHSVPTSVPDTAAEPSEGQVGEEYLPRAARPVEQAKATTVHSNIAALDEVRPKIYLIRLANGQVWRHAGINTMIFFNVGDDVTIQRYLFGSYHMSSPATGGSTNWVRVTRVE